MTNRNLDNLRSMTAPRYRNTMEWWNSFNETDQALLAQVILNNPAPTVVEALQSNAEFCFSTTALKNLRETLRKDN